MNRRKYFDLTGQRFGRLIAKELIGKRYGSDVWKCNCDCGNETEVIAHSLVKGTTKSCGCLKKELLKERRTRHGMSNTRIYDIWNKMKDRCTNKNNKDYSDYGGRGITICKEWLEFIPFYIWSVASGYDGVLSIDRVNNDGNYESSNCKWSTQKEQCNNKRTNIWYEFNGENKTISQWSDVCGISYKPLLRRIKRGWSIEKALLTPIKIQKAKKD